jgi:hypothetical protein
MIFSQTIVLESDNPTINITDQMSPLTLTINPYDLNLSRKIREIEYIWYDGTIDHITYKPDVIINNIDKGDDPKNFPQTKVFTNTKTLSTFNNIINIYTFGSSEPIVFNINITLNYPNIDNYEGIYDPFFENFHLIKTKMFGLNNNILYTFEGNGYNKTYTLMSLVNWKNKPNNILSVSELNKKINILEPYNVNFSNNASVSSTSYLTLSNSDNDNTILRIFP